MKSKANRAAEVLLSLLKKNLTSVMCDGFRPQKALKVLLNASDSERQSHSSYTKN